MSCGCDWLIYEDAGQLNMFEHPAPWPNDKDSHWPVCATDSCMRLRSCCLISSNLARIRLLIVLPFIA
jgi:hypothetical protein